MNSKKILNKISAIFVISFIIGTIIIIVDGYREKFELEDNGKISVGKYVSHESWGKGEVNYFVFYVNGEEHKANGGRAPKGFSENIGKFYKITYSEKNFTVNAFYDEEITDSLKIIESGFLAKDL
jgi:hypothetical protein